VSAEGSSGWDEDACVDGLSAALLSRLLSSDLFVPEPWSARDLLAVPRAGRSSTVRRWTASELSLDR
jgi:hypothetical protein